VSIDNTNYYTLLGVAPGASVEVINAAWRLAALENHPDLAVLRGMDYRESEKNMLLINQAHQILVDAVTRRQYDLENGLIKATCSRCGKPGSLRNVAGGAVTPICDACRKPPK